MTMMKSEIEKVERAGRARALLMALGAVILPLNIFLEFGDDRYQRAGDRSAIWLLMITLWMFLLWTGGGLRMPTRLRALLNDELSLRNRSSALQAGFYYATAGALAVFVINWWAPLATGDALKIVTGLAVSGALLHYAWLEWR